MLDAGNTLVFLDMRAVARIAAVSGVSVDAERLARAEGRAKRRYEATLDTGASHERGWGLYLTTLLVQAGVNEAAARALIKPLRAEHDRLNLWRRVPEGLVSALADARGLGLRLGVVSNSEGHLPRLFAHVGLSGLFDTIVDSAIEGVQKPDPEIFCRACERMRVEPGRALYAGDLPSVDVQAARRAGLRAALIDPLDFYPDHDGARYPSVAALVEDLRRARPDTSDATHVAGHVADRDADAAERTSDARTSDALDD